METVTILRELWQRRTLVVAVLLLALLAGTAVAYRISFPPRLQSRSYEVGVATSRILIDTPNSQVVEVAPAGSDTLGTRAGLIASLMVDGTVKAAIGHRAGLHPSQLDAVSEAAAGSETTPADPTPRRGTALLKTTVVTNAAGDELPIIEVEAQAADADGAARLAAAAVSGLRDYLNSKAALQKVPDAHRLQVDGLGAPQARDVTRGSRRLLAMVAALLVLATGCAAIVGGSRVAREWRAAAAEEPSEEPSDAADHEARSHATDRRAYRVGEEPAAAAPASER